MNTSLKTLLALIAFAVCPAVPFARAADTTAPAATAPATARPYKAIKRLQNQLQPLNLTEEQKAKVDAIIQDEEKAAADLRKNRSVDEANRETERQELIRSTQEKIRAVLTPEQAAKFGKHGNGNGKAGDKTEAKAKSPAIP